MTPIETNKEKQKWQDALPWIQFFVTLIITVGMYFWERTNSQAYIITFMLSIIGIYTTAQTFTLKKVFEDSLLPLKKIEEIFDLNADTQVFNELSEYYLRITENVFADIKNDIVQDAVLSLKEISQTKTLSLNKSQFYDQIFQMLEFKSIPYKKIWAVSTLLEHEWIDDQYEGRFLEENFRVAENNVVLERIFIIPDENIKSILANEHHPITRHFLYCPSCIDGEDEVLNRNKAKFCKTCSVKEKSNVRPYIVSTNFVNKYQPELLRQSYGFIAFDNRLIFVDSKDPTDESFSRISMSEGEIKKATDIFSTLKRYQVEICNFCQYDELRSIR